MTPPRRAFEIFLSCPPGLELALKAEAQEVGLSKPKATPGGVRFRGHWADIWRANLMLRGATRVLARIARFQATHLDVLARECRAIDWPALLPAGTPIAVETTCIKSRIYHQGAASERVSDAITHAIGPATSDADPIRMLLRIDDNQCTLSLDTSGTLLHKRGTKPFVGKAAIRETLAALLLRQAGYTGAEPVVDPMCGSGTFLLEAAEIALGLPPGRNRAFAFERLASFDATAWADIKAHAMPQAPVTPPQFWGSDRDAGAIAGARSNADQAGLGDHITFTHAPLGELTRPAGPPGLVMINPPYGTRIGDKKQLFGLYGALGKTLMQHFSGWRVGLVTTDATLARATGLPFDDPGAPIDHGGLAIRLWYTGTPLP